MGIRANKGLAEIDVNGNGDKISFFVSDNEFLKRLSDFFDWFYASKEEIEKIEAHVNEAVKSSKPEDLKTLVLMQEKLSAQTQEKLDIFFGDGTSKKIFGEISPTFACVEDVVFQLFEEIERILNEHNQHFVNRYSKKRKGAKS